MTIQLSYVLDPVNIKTDRILSINYVCNFLIYLLDWNRKRWDSGSENLGLCVGSMTRCKYRSSWWWYYGKGYLVCHSYIIRRYNTSHGKPPGTLYFFFFFYIGIGGTLNIIQTPPLTVDGFYLQFTCPACYSQPPPLGPTYSKELPTS